MKRLWVLPFMFLLGACATLNQANMDWIPIGPEFPQTMPPDVEILTDKSQITRPYGNLGLLRIKNLEPDRDTLKRGVEKARKSISRFGDDGVVRFDRWCKVFL